VIIRDLETTPEEPVSHDPTIMKRVLLRKGDVGNVMQFAEATLLPGQLVGAHAHGDMYELFLCRSGEGLLSVDGVTYPIRAGMLVACRPGEEHEIENTGSDPLLLLVLGLRDESAWTTPE
jgi:quercetin dioxygenase-like cupin family protein